MRTFIACADGVLGGTQCGRNSDLPLERPALVLLKKIDDGLRRVNRAATANGDDNVGIGGLEDFDAWRRSVS